MPYVHWKDETGRWCRSPYCWSTIGADGFARRHAGAVITDSVTPPAEPPVKAKRTRTKKAERALDAVATAKPRKRAVAAVEGA